MSYCIETKNIIVDILNGMTSKGVISPCRTLSNYLYNKISYDTLSRWQKEKNENGTITKKIHKSHIIVPH